MSSGQAEKTPTKPAIRKISADVIKARLLSFQASCHRSATRTSAARVESSRRGCRFGNEHAERWSNEVNTSCLKGCPGGSNDDRVRPAGARASRSTNNGDSRDS